MKGSTFTLPTKFVNAAKVHSCNWCGKQIQKGTLHHYWRSVGDSFTVNRMHHDCLQEAIKADVFEYKSKAPKC